MQHHDPTLWNTERLQREDGLLAVALGPLDTDHTDDDWLTHPDPDVTRLDEEQTTRTAELAKLGLDTYRRLSKLGLLTSSSQVTLRVGKPGETDGLTAVCVRHGEHAVVAVHPTGHAVAKGLLRLLTRCRPKPKKPSTVTADTAYPSTDTEDTSTP